MIITEKKPLNEIFDMLSGAKNVVVLGCSGCASVCETGGEVQVNELCNKLSSYRKNAKGFVSVKGICRVSDTNEFLAGILRNLKVKVDAFVVLSCGSGVQVVSEIISDVDVFPGLNSKRCSSGVKNDIISEKCIGCGDCILHLTGGICPFTLCPKNKFNGPCGDAVQGRCKTLEIASGENINNINNINIDCVWSVIYKKLKERKKENLINKLFKLKPRNWSSMNAPQRRYL